MCRAQDLPDTPEVRRLFAETNASLWRDFEQGRITKEYLIVERFARFLAALGVRRDAAACNAKYLEGLGAGVFPLPHAEEVCRALAGGHRLYLITDAVASVQRSRLRGSVFEPYFTGVFVSEEAGASKPDRAYFDYALAHISGAAAADCLVVGDSLTTDMQGANNAGLPCCWYNPLGLPRPEGLRLDHVIRDLRELLEIA